MQLVFIHGAGSNADFWHWQRSAFPDARYLDLPGHELAGSRQEQSAGVQRSSLKVQSGGRLSRITHHASRITHYADWVAQWAEDAGLRDVVLNGHSMGGAITQTLALRHPAWLRGIVLTGTGARLRVLPRLLELLRHPEGTRYPAAVDLIIEWSFADPSGSDAHSGSGAGPLSYAEKARRNGTRKQLLRTPQEVTLGDYEACDGFDIIAQVREISVPTLCIVGTQDRMTPPKYSRYLNDQIAGSRLEVIEGAGHMLPMEKPEEYNRKLADFLADMEQV